MTHSISAGLDYAAVGPEHARLRDIGRAEYTCADDREALATLQTLAKTEGIMPALESAHAIAKVIKRAPSLHSDQVLLVNLSGRGDKDLDTVTQALAEQMDMPGVPGNTAHEKGCILPVVIVHKRDR